MENETLQLGQFSEFFTTRRTPYVKRPLRKMIPTRCAMAMQIESPWAQLPHHQTSRKTTNKKKDTEEGQERPGRPNSSNISLENVHRHNSRRSATIDRIVHRHHKTKIDKRTYESWHEIVKRSFVWYK